MHSFVDNSRRTWEVAINVTAVKRIRGLLGIDLYALVDDGFKSLSKLVSDPVTLADVLYCLCKDQADKQSISDEDFGRALSGDVITQVGQQKIGNVSELLSQVAGLPPGKPVPILVWRSQGLAELTVTPGQRPAASPRR